MSLDSILRATEPSAKRKPGRPKGSITAGQTIVREAAFVYWCDHPDQTREIAEAFKVHPTTLKRWIREVAHSVGVETPKGARSGA